jgi:hypothetical protein
MHSGTMSTPADTGTAQTNDGLVCQWRPPHHQASRSTGETVDSYSEVLGYNLGYPEVFSIPPRPPPS